MKKQIAEVLKFIFGFIIFLCVCAVLLVSCIGNTDDKDNFYREAEKLQDYADNQAYTNAQQNYKLARDSFNDSVYKATIHDIDSSATACIATDALKKAWCKNFVVKKYKSHKRHYEPQAYGHYYWNGKYDCKRNMFDEGLTCERQMDFATDYYEWEWDGHSYDTTYTYAWQDSVELAKSIRRVARKISQAHEYPKTAKDFELEDRYGNASDFMTFHWKYGYGFVPNYGKLKPYTDTCHVVLKRDFQFPYWNFIEVVLIIVLVLVIAIITINIFEKP